MDNNYEVIPVSNYRELGMYIYREKSFPSIKGVNLSKYIDFEAIGKEYASKVNGQFNASGFIYKKQS